MVEKSDKVKIVKPVGAAVEFVYVAETDGALPKYVEVQFYVADEDSPETHRVDIPQDGRRYGAYLTENSSNHITVTLSPFSG